VVHGARIRKYRSLECEGAFWLQPSKRYFAYSGAVYHDLSTISPVHFVSTDISSPIFCSAATPGSFDAISKSAIEPLLLDPTVRSIQLEAPLARK